MLRRAGKIGVAEDVAGAVDARPLAVPDREHAVMLAFAEQFGLLRAPAGGRRELLVEARLEDDVGLGELLLGLPQLQVEPAERRAAIAGDEAGRVQPVPAVALALHQQHADDGLRAGQENTLLAEIELVVERDVVKRHQVFPLRRRANSHGPASRSRCASVSVHAARRQTKSARPEKAQRQHRLALAATHEIGAMRASRARSFRGGFVAGAGLRRFAADGGASLHLGRAVGLRLVGQASVGMARQILVELIDRADDQRAGPAGSIGRATK